MGTTRTTDGFFRVLFGKARRAILSLLFTHADQPYYIRQIVRIAGVGQGAVQRELRQLTNAGIVTRAVRGRQVYYQANQQCPIFQELHSIVVKTVGLGDLLRSALQPLAAKIRIAFVYGSMASANEGSRSDVDILIVGNVSFAETVSRLSPLQETLGREINPSVYSVAEFRQKLSRRNHFLRSVIETKKLFLIGDERELARVAR
jgi:DNA-binding transcriptional ArsR family regulator